MTTLYIREYQKSAHANAENWGFTDNGLQVAKEPGVIDQTVAIGVGSVASTPFGSTTRLVRIHADSICSILFGAVGTTPAALTTSARMVAGQTEYFGVSPGMTVAVIANS